MTLSDDIPLITESSRAQLNPRQLVDYEEHRRTVFKWLATTGKHPERVEGYSHAVVKNTAYRTDAFYRWVWDRDGYTTALSHDHADTYLREIAGRDLTISSKAKTRKALKRLYKWYTYERGMDAWEPDLTFHHSTRTDQPRDYLTKDERRKIREAALEYGSIPAYKSLAPGERRRWKSYLAMRFSKPKSEVTPDDWDRANGWKIPSLVWTSLDTGLRPIEVERASVTRNTSA